MDSDSSDSDWGIVKQRLPVATFTEYDPSKPAASGMDYLRRVQLDRKKSPKVIVADIDVNAFNSNQTFSIESRNGFIKATQETMRSVEWQREKVADFCRLRMNVSNLREKYCDVIEEAQRKPIQRNFIWWKDYCMGQQRDDESEKSNESDDNDDSDIESDEDDDEGNCSDLANRDLMEDTMEAAGGKAVEEQCLDSTIDEIPSLIPSTSVSTLPSVASNYSENDVGIPIMEEINGIQAGATPIPQFVPVQYVTNTLDMSGYQLTGGSSILRWKFSLPLKVNSTKHMPFLSLLLRLSQDEIHKLVKFHTKWLQQEGFTEHGGLWIYSLLACIDKPIPAIIHSTMRDLSRICSEIRQKTSHTCSEATLTSINLIICIVGRYFDQRDMIDE